MVRVNGFIALAVPLGVSLGVGLWMLSSLVPRIGRPRLTTRIAPYVTDVSADARELVRSRMTEPGSFFAALAAPLIRRARRTLSNVLGGDEAIARRLRQAGLPGAVDAFRSRQLVGILLGAAIGVAIAFVAGRTGAPVLLPVAAVVAGAAAGLLIPERLLARRAKSRLRRMSAELPTVLEFLALSLSAGESLADACRRVARTGRGELARELAMTIAETNAGVPLTSALARTANAVALPALTRCVDQLVTALDRGAPVGEVLRAQAQDAREAAGRELLEAAGRKEVAMMVPLVFLILPVTVIFAVFPGLLVLRLGF